MSKNEKIGLTLAIGAFIAAILLQGLFVWDCRKVRKSLVEMERVLTYPDSTCFSADRDSLYLFSNDKIYGLPLPKD
ncbi:MAG: hypothetical protein ACE5IR_24350 [bacterium]